MRLHADTSVLASRVFDTEERRQAARDALDGNEVCLCGYVMQELRATFLRDAALLYRLVKDSPDVWEALLRLRKYDRTRRETRATTLFALIMREVFSEKRAEPTEQAVLDYLEVFIEGEMMQQLRRGLQIVEHDNVRCHRADNVGAPKGRYYEESYRCTHPECGLADFLRSKVDLLRAVATAQCGLQEDLQSAAAEGVREPDSIRTTQCYGTLADLIIALECPDDATICTTNVREFCPICSALGVSAPIDANPQP